MSTSERNALINEIDAATAAKAGVDAATDAAT
jgi:hypothetical protein